VRVAIGNAPVSWGVEGADDERNPPWNVFLDQVSAAGYHWVELGPVGYLPLDKARTGEALSQRDMGVIGGYVYEPLSLPGSEDMLAAEAARSCGAVQALKGRYLVVIDRMNPERMACAGRSDPAPRLDASRFDTLVRNVLAIGSAASDAGLRAVFHPHVGSYVEFEDEIEKCLAALDGSDVGVCLDTGHTAYAGLDPVALYERYAERVEYFHFKDVDPAVRERVVAEKLGWDDAVANGIFRPLGQGVVDFAGLREALDRHDFDGWATVEQDTEPGKYDRAQTAAEASRQFLEQSGFAA